MQICAFMDEQEIGVTCLQIKAQLRHASNDKERKSTKEKKTIEPMLLKYINDRSL